jgi:hypothetical protein
MKRFFISAVVLFFGLAAVANGQDGFGVKSVKFTQNGAFASVSANTNPQADFNVNVSRGSSTISPASTFLNFDFITVADDNVTETVTIIFGEIPNSAFTGDQTQNMVLDLDTSTLDPSVTSSETCTIDLNVLSVGCGPVTQGVIHLEFRGNGREVSQILNHVEKDIFGPITTIIHSKSDNASANVQGSIFGAPVSSQLALVGVNHNSSIEVTRQ